MMTRDVNIENCLAKLIYFGLVLYFLFSTTLGYCVEIQRITNNTDDDTHVDIAKDSSGKVHLVYRRNDNVYYWSNSKLHSGGKEEYIAKGGSAAIAIGPNNVPQVVFTYGGANHTQRINGIWQTPEIVSPTWSEYEYSGVSQVDIAVDSVNDTYFVYNISNPYSSVGYNDLYLTTKKNGSISNYRWLHTGDYDGFGDYSFGAETNNPAVAVDANGYIHVVAEFREEQTSIENPELNYTKYSIRYFGDIQNQKFEDTMNEGETFDFTDTPVAMGSVKKVYYLSDNPIVADSSGYIHLAYHVGDNLFINKRGSDKKWTRTFSAPGRNGSLSYIAKDNSIGLSYIHGSSVYYRIANGSGYSSRQYVSQGSGPAIALGSIDVVFANVADSNREIFWAFGLEVNQDGDDWILFIPAIINKK